MRGHTKLTAVAQVRRIRPWIWVLFIVVASTGLVRLAVSYAERRIAARIGRAAAAAGLSVRYEHLGVGLRPLIRLEGITVGKGSQTIARIDAISGNLQLRGSSGLSVRAAIGVGAVRLFLPADIEVSLQPTQWELEPGRSIALTGPVSGLSFTATTGARGRAVDVAATRLNMDALGGMVIEGEASKELGLLDGGAHVEGDPGTDFQSAWRFTAFGGECGGSLIVIPGEREAKVQFQSSMKGLDFASILRSLGVDAPTGPNALGSLSGTVSASGGLHDPSALEVVQRIDFKRPERTPPEVLRLRDDFVLEVAAGESARPVIALTRESKDFLALGDVPPLFLRALLIAEDAAFFSHPGIDLTELPKAIATNVERGGSIRGASTITQQLAKNLFLSREKSLKRKLRELSYAFLLESTLGKERILEIYLNIIEWGPGLYGLRPAAAHYFAKDPQDLRPKEVAFLVSMIPGPLKYQRSIEGGQLRSGFETLVNNLLVKLRSVDVISEEEYQTALSETLVFKDAPPPIGETGNEGNDGSDQ